MKTTVVCSKCKTMAEEEILDDHCSKLTCPNCGQEKKIGVSFQGNEI